VRNGLFFPFSSKFIVSQLVDSASLGVAVTCAGNKSVYKLIAEVENFIIMSPKPVRLLADPRFAKT